MADTIKITIKEHNTGVTPSYVLGKVEAEATERISASEALQQNINQLNDMVSNLIRRIDDIESDLNSRTFG